MLYQEVQPLYCSREYFCQVFRTTRSVTLGFVKIIRLFANIFSALSAPFLWRLCTDNTTLCMRSEHGTFESIFFLSGACVQWYGVLQKLTIGNAEGVKLVYIIFIVHCSGRNRLFNCQYPRVQTPIIRYLRLDRAYIRVHGTYIDQSFHMAYRVE